MKIDNNLVAFITGASSGFGWQVACDLLKQGVKCYLIDRDDGAKVLTQQYSKNQCIFRQLDITDEKGIQFAYQDCVDTFKCISVVVNSAGISSPFQSILDESNDSTVLKHVLNVNVVGTFIVNKYAALQFVKQQQSNKEGQKKDYLIINFGSVASNYGSKGMVNYSASKGAVLGMTLPLARDLGRYGIRVVCFTPGFFNTQMGQSITPKLYAATAKTTALGRHGEPSELSAAVQGVIQSSFLTGTYFHMDSSFASPSL